MVRKMPLEKVQSLISVLLNSTTVCTQGTLLRLELGQYGSAVEQQGTPSKAKMLFSVHQSRVQISNESNYCSSALPACYCPYCLEPRGHI